MLRYFIFIAILVLTGCTTIQGGVSITDLDRPLIDLQGIASHSMPLGLRKTSVNSREYFSNYFITQNRRFARAGNSPERRYAHVLVLGDRRPYTIQVIVHVERRDRTAANGRGYSEVGTDLRLAKVIRQRIVQQLNKRREELNIIDDFRVF